MARRWLKSTAFIVPISALLCLSIFAEPGVTWRDYLFLFVVELPVCGILGLVISVGRS